MPQSRAGRPIKRAHKPDHAERPGFNGDESPLSWLASRKDKEGRPLIAREEFEAGEALRRDYTLALLQQRVTSSWSALPTADTRRRGAGTGIELTDAAIAARDRVNRALIAVGPELAGILIDVCCYLKGLEALEKSAGWPQRSGKIVLQIALQRLARHYGILHQASSGPPQRARLHHWGAHDYRPAAETDGPAAAPGAPQPPN